MTIYHLTEDISKASGGLHTMVASLDHYLNTRPGFRSVVVSPNIEEGDPYVQIPKSLPVWQYAKGIVPYLDTQRTDIDKMHVHGVFQHTQYAALKFAPANGVPSVLTAHGMLEPWYLTQKRLKKQLYLSLLLKKLMQGATALHAITPSEKENLFALTGHRNIIEIPNFFHYTQVPTQCGYNPESDYFLYLGRIHPGKGLDTLITALAQMTNRSTRLKIAGSENPYANIIRRMARDLNVEDRVEFIGWQSGEEKFKLYTNARAFVMPSRSEAIGIVNLEAAACKTPVITTFSTGLDPAWSGHGGLMVDNSIEALANALGTAAAWSQDERLSRGKALSEFARKRYSWEENGHLWDALYRSL